MEIEAIEGWKGQDVIDPDGESVGSLDDIVFDAEGGEPLLAGVKSGLFGRHSKLIPLAGARFARDHVRVAHRKALIKDAPGTAETTPTPEEVHALSGHYGGGPSAEVALISGAERAERAERAREASDRANELEALAARKKTESIEGKQQAGDAARQAEEAEEDRARALEEARRAREEAATADPPRP